MLRSSQGQGVNIGTIWNVLRRRRVLRSRERWDRSRLEVYRQNQLRTLRDFAYVKSPFYQKRHAGLTGKPLTDLPVITKAEMMEHFDDFVTDREIKLAEVQEYLANLAGNQKFLGKYWVSTTSGSTGRRGIIVSNFDEWMTTIASYSRANEWAGVKVDLIHRMKMAVVSSRAPWHQSARVGATVKSPWVPTLRIDAADLVASSVQKLNTFQPDNLVAYSSMLRILAFEQTAG